MSTDNAPTLEDRLTHIEKFLAELSDKHNALVEKVEGIGNTVNNYGVQFATFGEAIDNLNNFVASVEADRAQAQDVFVDPEALSPHEVAHTRAILARHPSDAPPVDISAYAADPRN